MNGELPLAVTVKVAVDPSVTAWLAGEAKIDGGTSTFSVKLCVTVPAVLAALIVKTNGAPVLLAGVPL